MYSQYVQTSPWPLTCEQITVWGQPVSYVHKLTSPQITKLWPGLVMKLIVVMPPTFMLNPSWEGTGWEQYAWTQLLGFSNLTSHSYSIPGLVKVYYCYPRGLEEYTCSADFPNLSVACPSSPCPLIWIYKLFLSNWNKFTLGLEECTCFADFPKSVCSTPLCL